jgi:hypothetical protein
MKTRNFAALQPGAKSRIDRTEYLLEDYRN